MLQVFRLKFSNYFNIWLLRRYFGGLNLYDLSMGAMGPWAQWDLEPLRPFIPCHNMKKASHCGSGRKGSWLFCAHRPASPSSLLSFTISASRLCSRTSISSCTLSTRIDIPLHIFQQRYIIKRSSKRTKKTAIRLL